MHLITSSVCLWHQARRFWTKRFGGQHSWSSRLTSSFFRLCLFVFLLFSFWKSWLMASWIVGCLILGVGFCNIYLIFLHTKNLKSSSRWAFHLLVHFFISLLFSVPKASWKVYRLFLLLSSQLFSWKSQLRSRNKHGLKQRQAPVHNAPSGFCFIIVFTL
jgi:hypothetical protein